MADARDADTQNQSHGKALRVSSALVLPGFCARALIPAGFMPAPGGLILCGGYAAAPVVAASSPGHTMSAMDISGMVMGMAGMDMASRGTIVPTRLLRGPPALT